MQVAQVVPFQFSATQATVSVGTSDQEVLAAASGSKGRRALYLYNAGANDIFVTVDGSTASATDGIKIVPGKMLPFSMGVPQGQIRGIADTAATNMIVIHG